MLDAALINPHAVAVMILIVTALVLYSRENIAFETTSLLVLVSLAIGFHLFPYVSADGQPVEPSEFFYGFGHKALVAVCALMIAGEGLLRTGALEPVGRLLARLWRRWPAIALLFTVAITAVMSMFVNDTPIVILMLPIVMGVAMRTGNPPSTSLIPVGFAAIVGGMGTSIGTSTNLLVVNVAADMGMEAFHIFDFVGVFALPALVAVLYLGLIAPRLLPERQAPMAQAGPRVYTAQVRLDDSSPAVGRPLAEAMARSGEKFRVESIQRGPGVFISPLPDVVLRAGDRVTTSDTQGNLRELARALGGTLFSGDHAVDDAHPLGAEGQLLAEVAITPASRLVGTAIGAARLRSSYGLRLLALNRYESSRQRRAPGLDETELQSGDVLLVQSTPENLDALKNNPEFLILDGRVKLPSTRKAPLALAVLVSIVLLAASRIMPIEVSAVVGVLVLIVSGCLSWKEAMNALNVRVILIIVASLAMGAALMKTGGADFIARAFVSLTFGAPPVVALSGVMLLIGVLTNIVSNNAAAVIGTPIAIGIAQMLGLPLEPFVLAVLFGANLSFATPMGYQTNVLIMNAAGYKFGDFVRVGLPLAILMLVMFSFVLAAAYGIA